MVYLSSPALDFRQPKCEGSCRDLRTSHHNKDQVRLHIQKRLFDLPHLKLRAPYPGLAVSQPLHRREPFLLGQKPRRDGRVWHGEAEDSKQHRQRSGQQVDVLPTLQPAPLDLGEPIVERPADDGEQARATEPPALPKALLQLRIISRNDAHKASGHDALDKAEEEALGVQAAVRGDGGREHADATPENDDPAEDAAEIEALQREGHRVQSREHAKVKERGRPREPRCVDAGRVCAVVSDGQLQVGRHAEENGRAENGLVIVDDAILKRVSGLVRARAGVLREVAMSYSQRSWRG